MNFTNQINKVIDLIDHSSDDEDQFLNNNIDTLSPNKSELILIEQNNDKKTLFSKEQPKPYIREPTSSKLDERKFVDRETSIDLFISKSLEPP